MADELDKTTKDVVRHRIYQEAVYRQGTGKPIRVKYCGKTYEGTPHERGSLLSDIQVEDIHEV